LAFPNLRGGATWPNPHPMAKRGMAIPNLRGAYMAKGERGPPSLAIPLRGGCLYGLRGGWGVPTWPKREVGEPFGPFGQRRGGRGATSALWPKERPAWPKEGCLHGQRPGGERFPLWPPPPMGAIWPKEREGRPPMAKGGGYMAKRAFGPPLAIPYGRGAPPTPPLFGQRTGSPHREG